MHGAMFILLSTTILLKFGVDAADLYSEEIRSLSELPMKKLIQIKSSLAVDSPAELSEEVAPEKTESGTSERRIQLTLPVALPLRKVARGPNRRYGDHYDEKEKETKISKIFQLAVTALSFLAFGGYLMTLIITAIRRSNAAGNGNVIVFSNLQSLQKYATRPKRSFFHVLDPTENDFESERLYEGLVMLSRGYARYHEANNNDNFDLHGSP